MKGIKAMWNVAAVLLIGVMLAMALPLGMTKVEASPATVYVPDDYPTIQAAVDAASPGDTIIVRNGTYTENVDVNKDHLTIRSQNWADSTIAQVEDPDDYTFKATAY